VYKLTGWPFDVIRRQSVRDLKLLTEAEEVIDWDPVPDLSWMKGDQ